MTPSESLMHDLVSTFPDLHPFMSEHLKDQEGELLPYLLMADIARWAERVSIHDPERVATLTAWLGSRYDSGDEVLKDLIGVGFVEMIPQSPDGDPILEQLPPSLRSLATQMGLCAEVVTTQAHSALSAEYPALWHFLGAYLHQDWQDDYPTLADALTDFMDGEPALAPRLGPDIDSLLGSTATSGEVDVLIVRLGSFFNPSSAGLDARDWLRTIRTGATQTSWIGGTLPSPVPGRASSGLDNLEHLISGYFYEFWDEHECSSWQDAVDHFVRRSPERAASVPSEITNFLAGDRGDEDLAEHLAQWGFDAATPHGEREWLLRVQGRITNDLAAGPA